MSTVQFMTEVHVEEPKESAFSRCPWQRKMHTEDGVTSGSERLRKPGKWTRILEQTNYDKIYTCEKHFDPEDTEIWKYRFMNSSTITYTLETSSHILKRNGGDHC